MIYFISDTHFGHAGMFKRRPSFSTIEEMDETIIENWNRKVKRGDTVYILGDFVCKSEKPAPWYLERLQGKKILIIGNHDACWMDSLSLGDYFESVSDYKEITLDGKLFTLCHYPMLEWKNSRKIGMPELGYLIHGHIHNRISELYRPLFSSENALNAGVDINGYEPVTLQELFANNQRFKQNALGILEQRKP